MRPNATGVSAALPGGPQICDNCSYFNTAAFTQTPQYAFGNVSRYLPDVNNPRATNLDSSLEKSSRITERVHLTFRAELFNATNHVIFSGPSTSITSSTFGKITLSQSNAPRQVQFSLRLGF
jgi:selenocysteine lyase/cysteine desulfurase